MSEMQPDPAAGTAPEGQDPHADPEGAPPPAKEVDWKSKAREWEKRAKANADAATRLKEIEDSQKTAEERMQEQLKNLTRERDEAHLNFLRMKVGTEKGLPPRIAALLQGGSEEEMSAQAETILAEIGPKAPGRRTKGDAHTGTAGGSTDPNVLIRSLFQS